MGSSHTRLKVWIGAILDLVARDLCQISPDLVKDLWGCDTLRDTV